MSFCLISPVLHLLDKKYVVSIWKHALLQLQPAGEEDAALEMCPSCPAHLSPVSTEAPHSHSQLGAVTWKGLPCAQGPGQMPAGTPWGCTPLHSWAGGSSSSSPASLQARCTGRKALPVGMVGMLPWSDLHTSWNTCSGSAQTNLHSALLPPPCAQQTEATTPASWTFFMVKKPSSPFDLVFRGQSACSDLWCPFYLPLPLQIVPWFPHCATRIPSTTWKAYLESQI